MEKELNAALKAAKGYKPRNLGDAEGHALIVGLLSDCLHHHGRLKELADARASHERVEAAHAELRNAQAGIGPDTQLTP